MTKTDEIRLGEALQSVPSPSGLGVPTADVLSQAKQTKRRKTAVTASMTMLSVAGVTAVALWGGQFLLPETAETSPAGASNRTVDAVATLPPAPDWADVTFLTEPRTATGTGTQTVDLGARPEGATGAGMLLECLSPGEFRYPDGAILICDEADAAGLATTADDTYVETSYVVDLAEGVEQIEIGAPEGASWRLTTSYVSTEVAAD
ncbi:hypothetical protein MWU75_07070 [Ornithinimicrobium sp. F0845]|uniref:hypothetical protein n=1 Tax=Ornithinimicrobium sp. F0845 TaxID=2926412 RepID=UPI001FF54988|nr:hypothetical protein [Ornithinimicrobium sp. F0845]MCK0111895.1 hypothetical protein [Ornithinimicrobium sp. F0845]